MRNDTSVSIADGLPLHTGAYCQATYSHTFGVRLVADERDDILHYGMWAEVGENA